MRLLGGVVLFLIISTGVSWVLTWRFSSPTYEGLLMNLRQRICACSIMIAILFGAIAAGKTGTIAVFAALSLLALTGVHLPGPTRGAPGAHARDAHGRYPVGPIGAGIRYQCCPGAAGGRHGAGIVLGFADGPVMSSIKRDRVGERLQRPHPGTGE